MMDLKVNEIRAFLQEQKHVKVAYLFGSRAKGRVGPLSDFDIAILLDRHLNKQESFNYRLSLLNDLSSILKTRKLDVVIMNNAPLLLNYNIIKKGKVLYCRDELARVRFETYVLSRYLDRKYYDERHIKRGIKRMAEKGLL
jgi:hypothetical protein